MELVVVELGQKMDTKSGFPVLCKNKRECEKMSGVGFEPTPSKRLAP